MEVIKFVPIEKCDACGLEHVEGLVACSMFGAYTGAWCKACLHTGRDSYSLMVSYISNAGRWPDDINEDFQEEVRHQLKLHGKTEEEFKQDLIQYDLDLQAAMACVLTHSKEELPF